MSDNYTGGFANAQQLQCEAKSAGIGRYIPPTKRQRLENAKLELEKGLAKVNLAIAALDTHPDLEQFMNVIEAAGI